MRRWTRRCFWQSAKASAPLRQALKSEGSIEQKAAKGDESALLRSIARTGCRRGSNCFGAQNYPTVPLAIACSLARSLITSLSRRGMAMTPHFTQLTEAATNRLMRGRKIGGRVHLGQGKSYTPSTSDRRSIIEPSKAQIRTCTQFRPMMIPRRKIGSCSAQIEGSSWPSSRQLRIVMSPALRFLQAHKIWAFE
jgi:hypothetical protein